MHAERSFNTADQQSFSRVRAMVWAVAFCSTVLPCVPSQAQDRQVALPAGVSLPVKGGIYAVQPEKSPTGLVQLHATEIVSNSHAAGNFARSMVYTGPRSSVELDGVNSSTHLTDHVSFLIRLSDDSPETYRERFALVRLRQNANRRVVSSFSQNIFGGQRKREYDVVPVTRADVDNPTASWLLLTPAQPLTPGEYGILIMPKDANLFTDEVYDFNIDFDKAKPDSTEHK